MVRPLDLNVLKSMYDMVRRDVPKYDTAHVSPREFDKLRKNEVQYSPTYSLDLYGMRVQVSSMFPYTLTCDKCLGTGEGETSTYCPKCKGAGAERVEGMITGKPGNICLIVSPLPKRFAPRWPADVLVPKRPLPRL